MAKKTSAGDSSSPRRRRRRTNKSAAIRAYIAEHPEATPAEIVAALKAQRIRVTPQFVSTTKSKANGSAKAGASSKAAAGDTTPYAQIKKAGELFSEALELVMKAGAKEAESLVQMAGKMVQRIRERQ